MVVTTLDGRSRAKLAQSRNRKWATIIQGVNALGQAIPSFIILVAQYHLVNWYSKCNLLAKWVIKITRNGWTTNEIDLNWIQHFDQYTIRRTKGTHRLLILDSHKSHYSTAFETYYQNYNIITLYMPIHSSYYLQPLDISYFRPLKQVYSYQIKDFMYTHINYISKLKFLYTFREAFFSSIIEKNI